jgi:putative molybdenum carrier protein
MRWLVPEGRKAEDGRIDPKYPLIETPSANYVQRTEWNVRDTGVTVILSIDPVLTGGSRKTAEFAVKHNKPCLHLHPARRMRLKLSGILLLITRSLRLILLRKQACLGEPSGDPMGAQGCCRSRAASASQKDALRRDFGNFRRETRSTLTNDIKTSCWLSVQKAECSHLGH